jgi:hypothetical protein
MNVQKITMTFCFILFFLSYVVVERLIHKKSAWEFIVTYWVVLMIKNLIDILGVK